MMMNTAFKIARNEAVKTILGCKIGATRNLHLSNLLNAVIPIIYDQRTCLVQIECNEPLTLTLGARCKGAKFAPKKIAPYLIYKNSSLIALVQFAPKKCIAPYLYNKFSPLIRCKGCTHKGGDGLHPSNPPPRKNEKKEGTAQMHPHDQHETKSDTKSESQSKWADCPYNYEVHKSYVSGYHGNGISYSSYVYHSSRLDRCLDWFYKHHTARIKASDIVRRINQRAKANRI